MAQPVILPKLGQTVEEAAIVAWRKQEGDAVKKGDILFEIETDKAVLEVESFFDGTLLKILIKEGVSVPVSTTVAFIGEPGEKVPDAPPPPKKAASPKTSPETAATPPKSAAPVPDQPRKHTPDPLQTEDIPPPRHRASPRARKLLRESAVDPTPVKGTGPGGRITERDVVDYLQDSGYHAIRISPAAKALAIAEEIDIISLKERCGDRRILVEDIRVAIREKPEPMPRIRQVIAERMTRSATTIPHFFVTVPVDMTDLLLLRKELKKQKKQYSVSDFIIKACADALLDFPLVNSSTDGKMVQWHSSVNIGLAVDIKGALVVPVVRNVERMNMDRLHEEARSLATKARDGKLTPDEMSGGTFTVSNMGMLNVENFTAIINPGESAILAVSSTIQTPVVIGKEVAVRSIMKITLSSDHRVVDGAMAARFINRIKSNLEDIDRWKSMM